MLPISMLSILMESPHVINHYKINLYFRFLCYRYLSYRSVVCYHPIMKHIDVHHHFLKDSFTDGKILLAYILTKSVVNQKLSYCLYKIGIV